MNEDLLEPFVAAVPGSAAQRVRFDVRPAQPLDLPGIAGLLAGAAEVDITPPPGMPKAGHSANAHNGSGFRTRLHAHVLHLRAGTTSLALVQCDLLAGSAVLQQLIARGIEHDTDVRLPGLFIGATHTHAGPGQFHGNELMNRFASNHSGFDPAWTSELVSRIAGAVREAVATRRPARLAFGATEVWGLTRNRSVDSFVRNENVAADSGAQQKFAAINPWLHLLRVDAESADGGFEPLAATVIFSVHGTGISHHDHAYNADIWAYLKGELGRHVQKQSGHRIVVGAVEGTHGDVAPAVRPGLLAYPETERVGTQIGVAAGALWDRLEARLSADVELAAGFREIDLREHPKYGGITLPAPAFGAATIAGAHENTTPVVHHLPPFRPGVPKPGAKGPHGAKWIPGGRYLHDRIVPPASFPSILPVQVLRIGPTLVVGLPFEITVESGRRIQAAVRTSIGAQPAIEHVAVSSLANEQFCYLTTPEEYSLQRYEGGNTLYGPSSAPFVAAYAARLAADVLTAGTVADQLPERRFDFKARRYLAVPTGRRVERRPTGAPTFTDPTVTEDGYWQFEWLDGAPGDLCWNEPMVRVEVAAPDGGWLPATEAGVRIDDQGYHLGVLYAGAGRDGRHRYQARWYTPYLGPAPAHRIVVLADAAHPELGSPGFC
ncbi:MAG: neutral/alkaline non-lysosomal ceramidase N-terminal domain-containing protein [Jatrophihabitantaceae bacterium]